MIAKTAKQRKQEERVRMRAAGFVLFQCWVHKQDLAAVSRYASLKLERRKETSAKLNAQIRKPG